MRAGAALVSVSCAVATALLGLTACGGSGEGTTAGGEGDGSDRTLEELWRAPGDDVAVVPGTQTYEPGEVRVSFLVVDSEAQVVTLPTARVWVARALEERPFLETEAKLERIGTIGGATGDSTHIYVTRFRLARPGTYWFLAEPQGGPEAVQALGNVVVERSTSAVSVGEDAPMSETPTIATAPPSQITTKVPPDVTLLRHSVAGSLRAGLPFVVTFATPEFCSSRACGPVVDVVEEVARRLEGGDVRFIHVEVFTDNDPTRGYNRWMREWGLRTEPWTFVVGRDGKVAERYEGVVSVRELEAAVREVAGL